MLRFWRSHLTCWATLEQNMFFFARLEMVVVELIVMMLPHCPYLIGAKKENCKHRQCIIYSRFPGWMRVQSKRNTMHTQNYSRPMDTAMLSREHRLAEALKFASRTEGMCTFILKKSPLPNWPHSQIMGCLKMGEVGNQMNHSKPVQSGSGRTTCEETSQTWKKRNSLFD